MCAVGTCSILFKQSLFLLTRKSCTCVLPQAYTLFMGVIISKSHADGRREIKGTIKYIELCSITTQLNFN